MGDAVIKLDLPEIIELNDFGGNVQAYIEHIYNVFVTDFNKHKVFFRGKRVMIIVLPRDSFGREYSFVHSTSTGPVEEDRLWDLSRSARICWLKPLIESADTNEEIIVWENVRRIRRKKGGKKKTIHTQIFYTRKNFLISLEQTTFTWKFLSCYQVPKKRQKKYIEEYKKYIETGEPVDASMG